MLSSIGAAAGKVEAGSPFLGADIDVLTYAAGDTQKMYEQTRQAITLAGGADSTMATSLWSRTAAARNRPCCIWMPWARIR